LTGAFAGSGGFSVSPILGYQAGGPKGTPGSTTSRQFQAGLSVTGQGAAQNATLFVMTSQITNAPNIGFTQGGGFNAVTMRNAAGWYGTAVGAVSSGQPGSANTVPNANGLPNGPYTIYNANANLESGSISNKPPVSTNYVPPKEQSYAFNPISAGTATTSANNHPSLFLTGYVGGVMATASGGTSSNPASVTRPYVITNLTGQPGDVGIFLPGSSSEMLAFFNVASQNAPAGGMTSATNFFGGLDVDGVTGSGLNSARGTYVNPSNFAARAATIYDSGANTPISIRNGQSLGQPGGFAQQLMVTADSVGANTARFLSSISSTAVTPCACDSTKWGFWSAFNGVNNSDGSLQFMDQGALLLWVGGVALTPSGLSGLTNATGTATYSGHAIADIATGAGGRSYLAAGAFSNTVDFGNRTGAVTITGLDGANYSGTVGWSKGTATFATTAPLTSLVTGRTAAINGSFFQGAAINSFGEMGGSLILTGPGNYLGSGIFAARR